MINIKVLTKEKTLINANQQDEKTILLIDDEVAVLKVYTDILQKNGYNVLNATNAREGIQILIKMNVDLLITDIMMPNGNGLELLKKMRSIILLLIKLVRCYIWSTQ